MDISVSRLNRRMALQVPMELPLGLVFIVGQVSALYVPHEVRGSATFDLVEGEHFLRCRIPAHVVEETLVKEGDRIRVSGRLAFDAQLVQYYLSARHLEVLAQAPPDSPQRSILSDVKKRAEQTAVVEADLPPWVEQLAPPEVQRELELMRKAQVEVAPQMQQELAPIEPEPVESVDFSGLSPEMIEFLSTAIDSDDDIELTTEMIAEYLPQERPLAKQDKEPVHEAGQEPPMEDAAEAYVLTATASENGQQVEQNVRSERWQFVAVVLLAFLIIALMVMLTLLLR